tara:strand:- start:2161 stop:3102 length:942 start_codon:yes stop_codon:yes gene_type:complete
MSLEIYQNQDRYWLCCPCEPPVIEGGVHLQYFAGGYDPKLFRTTPIDYPTNLKCAKYDRAVYTEDRSIADVTANYRIEIQYSQDPVTDGILQPIDDAILVAASGTYTRVDVVVGTSSTTISISGNTIVANVSLDDAGTITTALWHGVISGQTSIAWTYQSGDGNTLEPDGLWDSGTGGTGVWAIFRLPAGGSASYGTSDVDLLEADWTWSVAGWDKAWVLTRDYPNQVQAYHTDLDWTLGLAIEGDARHTLFGGGSPTKYDDIDVNISTVSGLKKYSELQTLAYQTESCLDFVNITAAGLTPTSTNTTRIAHA